MKLELVASFWEMTYQWNVIDETGRTRGYVITKRNSYIINKTFYISIDQYIFSKLILCSVGHDLY